MMLITHGASFLSDALVRTLNRHNFNYLVVTDDNPSWKPPSNWRLQEHLPPTPLPDWFKRNRMELEFAFCLDVADDETNDAWFQTLWQQCIACQVPLIFRTTAARSAWVARQTSAPFFWAGLRANSQGNKQLAPSSSDSSGKEFLGMKAEKRERSLAYARDVAQAAYFLVHHRQQSGDFAIEDVYQNLLRGQTSYKG